jgi:Tfp pilus assembly protein PilN
VIRINLIPPEILASRRDESRWKWVWLSGGIIALVVALAWSVMYLQVAASTSDVASIQQQAATKVAETSRFNVFQQKEADLQVRQSAVDTAIAGKIDWSEMLYELGLVLPKDVYLTTFTGVDNGSTGSVVTLAGQARFDPETAPAVGYKSIAKMLVRLTELTQLDSVWLTSASLGTGTDTQAPMYTWSVNANITPVATQTASSGQ